MKKEMKSPPPPPSAFVATALWNSNFLTTISRSYSHHSELYQFTASSSEFNKDYSKYQEGDDCDANARSQFGTKSSGIPRMKEWENFQQINIHGITTVII